MSKNSSINELTNLLAKSLRHKIGAIVNFNDLYAQKYLKDAGLLLRAAEKVCIGENWNIYDKEKIKIELRKKLRAELERCSFLNERKFDIIEVEMEKVLKEMGLGLE